ncbi:MAG: hypothetical protein HC842_09115 [Cytophagales bacterium]|nr:hypothetical protein [Cytophagales bacterium]
MILTGMELIILVINLILFVLKPSLTWVVYTVLIAVSILAAQVHHQAFLDIIPVRAIDLHYLEIIAGVLVFTFHALFTAFYLRAHLHAKALFYIMAFPFFFWQLYVVVSNQSSHYAAATGIHFLLITISTILLMVKVWNKEKHRCHMYLIANGPPILAATLTVLAHNGIIKHTYFTADAVYLGILMRDVLFTLDWFNDYFRLQKESARNELDIQRLEKRRNSSEKSRN